MLNSTSPHIDGIIPYSIHSHAMTTQEKLTILDKISEEILKFKKLDIARNCTNPVPGEGHPDAQIMFIGEAPGFNEDRLGRPFVGQAGKLLEKTLVDTLQLSRSDVYITNIVKFRPPDNRDPLPEEITACSGWLDRQIDIISPQIIVTLGRFSLGKFLPDISISKIHGQARFVEFNGKKIIIFPMYHPAAALRSGAMMSAFIEDFSKLKNLLSKTLIPPTVPESESKPVLIQSTLF